MKKSEFLLVSSSGNKSSFFNLTNADKAFDRVGEGTLYLLEFKFQHVYFHPLRTNRRPS